MRKFLNVNELFDFLNENESKYYFRGYKYKNQLIPKIGRDDGHKINEFKMINELSEIPQMQLLKVNTVQRLLEIGQHYGIPTRLLDWSFDPYVAFFFALWKKYYDNKPVYLACLDKKKKDFPPSLAGNEIYTYLVGQLA